MLVSQPSQDHTNETNMNAMNPLQRRRQAELDKVKKLVAESGGTLILIRTSGNPPSTYVIEYHCRSLVRDPSGVVSIQNKHQVEINLGLNYPIVKPTARFLTPIFNPHVFPSNIICLGANWNAGDTLDMLILKLGALLQLDPRVIDPNSLANIEAYHWVTLNQRSIPLGTICFKAAATPPSRIQWTNGV
jgi:hypothetical protein